MSTNQSINHAVNACRRHSWKALASGSYLIAAGDCRRRLHLLGDNTLLLVIRIQGAGGGHCLLLELFRLGILAQILVRGGCACGDRSRCDIGATQVGGCGISLVRFVGSVGCG